MPAVAQSIGRMVELPGIEDEHVSVITPCGLLAS